MRAFGDLLSAGIANLSLLYAARIAGAALCARADRDALVAALRRERDAAIEALRMSLEQEREQALVAARSPQHPRRFRIAAIPSFVASLPRQVPQRPAIRRAPAAASPPSRQLRP